MRPLWSYWIDIKWSVITWWYWHAFGWPTKRRCPQCSGSGKYCSEAEARHADPYISKCGMCGGTGKVRRK